MGCEKRGLVVSPLARDEAGQKSDAARLNAQLAKDGVELRHVEEQSGDPVYRSVPLRDGCESGSMKGGPKALRQGQARNEPPARRAAGSCAARVLPGNESAPDRRYHRHPARHDQDAARTRAPQTAFSGARLRRIARQRQFRARVVFRRRVCVTGDCPRSPVHGARVVVVSKTAGRDRWNQLKLSRVD